MGVTVRFDGKDVGVEEALKKIGGAATNVDRTYKELARSASTLERKTKKSFDEAQSGAVRYKRQLEQLRLLRKLGRLDEDQYAFAVKKARHEIEASGRAGKAAFGPKAASMISGMIGPMAAFGAATAVLTRELEKQLELRRAAAEFNRQSEGGLAQLAQLATSPESMQKLLGQARGFMRAGVSESEAGQMTFSLQSAGLGDQMGFFQELAGSKLFANVGDLGASIAALQTSLGKAETGDARAIMSKAIAASAFSPAEAGALLAASTRGAGGAKALGLTDEEGLSATAILAAATKSAELGGTQYASLTTSLAQGFDYGGKRYEFKGKSLEESVAVIAELERKQGLTFDDLKKSLGRKEAVLGYSTLRDQMGLFREALSATNAAAESKIVDKRMRLISSDDGLRRSRVAREATSATNVSLAQRFGSAGELLAVAQAETRGDQGGFEAAVRTAGALPYRYLRNDVQKLKAILSVESVLPGGPRAIDLAQARRLSPDLLRAIVEVLEQNNQLSNRQVRLLGAIADRSDAAPEAASEVAN